MRSLPKSFLPILVASALLLSAASVSGSDKEHQNQPRTHDRDAARKSNPAPSPFTVIVQPAPVQILRTSPAVEKTDAQKKWYQRPTVTDWGILVVTILYTAISIGLFVTTKNAARAAQRSADAALATAEAAKLTLGADRPFLMAEEPDLRRPAPLITATLHFRNRGKGTAIIDRIVMSLEPAPEESDHRALIARAKPEKQVTEIVIGPAEKSSRYNVYCLEPKPVQSASGSFDVHAPLKALLEKKEILTLFGFIEYHDTSGGPHITEFVWSYAPLGSGYWYSDYNRQT